MNRVKGKIRTGQGDYITASGQDAQPPVAARDAPTEDQQLLSEPLVSRDVSLPGGPFR